MMISGGLVVFRVLDLRLWEDLTEKTHITNYNFPFQLNLNGAYKYNTQVRNFLEERGFLPKVSYIFKFRHSEESFRNA